MSYIAPLGWPYSAAPVVPLMKMFPLASTTMAAK